MPQQSLAVVVASCWTTGVMFCALIFDRVKAAMLISTTALPLLSYGSNTLKHADDSCFYVLIPQRKELL